MDLPLHLLPATRLLQLYASRELSPVEAVEAALAAIERHNPKFNAFCVVDGATALKAARESEKRWMRAEPMGTRLIDSMPPAITMSYTPAAIP